MNSLIPVLLLFSGFSALAYQVIWLRLLSISIGATGAAVGAVLASIFLGMAVGSWLSGRLPHRWRTGLKSFALLELVIGISALALLPLILNLDHLLTAIPSLGSLLWFRFLLVMLLLIIPTACIGAAYPLAANIYSRSADTLGGDLSKLYMTHTAGAVVGVLVAAFYLIPSFGLDGAIYLTAGINLSAAVAAWFSASKWQPLSNQTPDTDRVTGTGSRHRHWSSTVILATTGFATLCVESAWIKYLTIYTGSTLYGFSLLLAFFLASLTLGAGLARRFADRGAQRQNIILILLLLLGVFIYINRTGLGFLPDIEMYLNDTNISHTFWMFIRYSLVFLLIAPVAFILGMLFPLTLREHCGTGNGMVQHSGHGYALNTLFGILGAVLSGLWLIPMFGSDGLLLLNAALVLFVATFTGFYFLDGKMKKWFAVGALGITIIGSLMPGLRYDKMVICMQCVANLIKNGESPKVVYTKEGQVSVISLIEYVNGNIELKSNNLTEATLPVVRSRGEVLLGLLPSIFRPDANNAFIIGYGGGITTEVVAATDIQSIKVVEIEPAVIDAMKYLNGGTIPLLGNQRVELIHNDARNTLLLDKQKYDIIISQPSHPWRNGMSSMFSSNFFSIAKSRLTEDGVHIQWLNLFNMDISTMKSVFASFYTTYDYGVIFATRDPAQVFMIGANQPLVMERGVAEKLMNREKMRRLTSEAKLHTPDHLLQYLLFTRDEALEIASPAELATDLNLIPESRLGLLDFASTEERDKQSIKLHQLLREYAFDMTGVRGPS